MQANEIWSGNHYAYSRFAFRGTIPLNCEEVVVIRVFQKEKLYNSRKTTFVEVHKPDVTDRNFTVEARRIVDHWSDYVDYRDSVLAKRKKADFESRLAEQYNQYVNRLLRDTLMDKVGLPVMSCQVFGNRVTTSFVLDKLLVELELEIPDFEEFKIGATKEYESTLAAGSN